MIDVHCHLNFHSFEKDYDQVIQDAKKVGVHTIINVGTSLESSEHAVRLADQYENLYAIVGIHPHHADKVTEGHPKLDSGSPDNWLKSLKQIASHPKVLGIGECGMDYYSYASNGVVEPKRQKEIFEAQIQLAHDLNLPLQIHHRQVGKELIEILQHHKSLLKDIPGMFHCFAGSTEFLKDALDLGFFIGFDGNITYPGIAKGETVALSELAKLTPLERIVTETDSPFLTPVPHRGERNSPAYIPFIVQALAQIKNVSETDVVEQTTKNVYTLFSTLPNRHD